VEDEYVNLLRAFGKGSVTEVALPKLYTRLDAAGREKMKTALRTCFPFDENTQPFEEILERIDNVIWHMKAQRNNLAHPVSRVDGCKYTLAELEEHLKNSLGPKEMHLLDDRRRVCQGLKMLSSQLGWKEDGDVMFCFG